MNSCSCTSAAPQGIWEGQGERSQAENAAQNDGHAQALWGQGNTQAEDECTATAPAEKQSRAGQREKVPPGFSVQVGF